MDFVVFKALSADGLERPESNVKSDFCDFDISRADALQDFWREVQTRSGRGNGASLPRVDGLISLAIGGLVGAFDVGRQGECGPACASASWKPVFEVKRKTRRP